MDGKVGGKLDVFAGVHRRDVLDEAGVGISLKLTSLRA